jgi:hypothetical protein
VNNGLSLLQIPRGHCAFITVSMFECLPGAHHSLHVTTVNFLRLECSVLVGRMALGVRMTNGFSHSSKSIFLCYFLDINR